MGIAKENVAGITRDNAANMDVAMAELGFPDTSCFGHTLQLGINAALNHPEIQAFITACRNVEWMKQKSSTEGPGDGGEPSLPTLKMEI